MSITTAPRAVPPYGRRPWMRAWFRWLVTLAAVLAFGQAALAGAYLSGHYTALNLHSMNANIASVAALGATVVGLLIRRPGGGPWWPALVSGGVVLAEATQTFLGYAHALSLHVPLGVAVIAGLVVLLLHVWRPDTADRDDRGASDAADRNDHHMPDAADRIDHHAPDAADRGDHRMPATAARVDRRTPDAAIQETS